jgi:hypothetical protein
MIRSLRKVVIALIVPLVLTGGMAATGLAAPPQGKTTLCHAAGSKYVEITVASNAVPAHMAHGDVLPDDYGECP